MPTRLRFFGVISAVIAWIVTVTVPLYATSSDTVTSDGATTSTEGTATLIEVNGWGGAIPGLILVLLSVGVWRAPYVMARWICLGLFLAFTALTMFSIGMFFLPAALLLILGISLERGDPEPV